MYPLYIVAIELVDWVRGVAGDIILYLFARKNLIYNVLIVMDEPQKNQYWVVMLISLLILKDSYMWGWTVAVR